MSARGPSFAAELLKALRTERLSVRGACAAVDCSEKAAVYWLSERESLGIVVTSTGEKGRTRRCVREAERARQAGPKGQTGAGMTTEAHDDSSGAKPLGLGLGEGLGPFAELHEPESEFEDGTWHKPLPQGWSGGTLVYTEAQMQARVAAERDCRACKSWTPHHRSDVMHCSAALRCVAGSSYQRQGVVQLWEAAPVDVGF